MSDKSLLRQLARIGINDFETADRTKRWQNDLLRVLAQSSVKPDRYARLEDCKLNHCGRNNCSAACFYGARRMRLHQILAAHRLIREDLRPIHEVRLSRDSWWRPPGQLRQASVAAAKQLNRRALDRLYITDLIAVGTFKVAVAPQHMGRNWICEIHELVAGASKDELEKAFSGIRGQGSLRINEVQNYGEALADVLSLHPHIWLHPEERPSRSRRKEHYRWQLGLKPGARILRYGCDRYFNALAKQPRPQPLPVPKKKRRYPEHLVEYMLGPGAERPELDPNSEHFVNLAERLKRSPPTEPPADYYDLGSDDEESID